MGILFGLLSYLFIFGILGVVFLFLLSQADKLGVIALPKRQQGSNNEDNIEGDANGQNEKGSLVAWQEVWGNVSEKISVITTSFIFRFGLVAILTGLMTIPLGMLGSFVNERNNLHRGVLQDISNIWGQKQDLQGPAIFVPFTEKFIDESPMRNKKGKIMYDRKGRERKVKKARYEKRTAILLPEDLNIKMDIMKKSRKRGLYTANVYNADLKVSGFFVRPDNKKFSAHADVVHWEKAWFSFGLSDTRAINKISALQWDRQNKKEYKLVFEPGTGMTKVFLNGFQAALPFAKQKKRKKKGRGRRRKVAASKKNAKPELKKQYDFSFTMNINGSKGLFFYPSGKTTDVSIISDWPHPSFQGNILPNGRKVHAKGFEAQWHVPHLARSFPQFWTLEQSHYNLKEFKAGVMMFEAVSLYSKITRAIKYGLLFIGLTYLTFLIFEMGIGRRLHVVQYGMIGLALTMFYLTLLSMAEHTGFLKAYVAAATIIIAMISLYALAAIRKIGRTAVIALMLSGLYATLYALLQLESYALLSGTVILLIILALMMYLTRNIGNESQALKKRA